MAETNFYLRCSFLITLERMWILQSNDTTTDFKILRDKNKKELNAKSTIVYFTLHVGIHMWKKTGSICSQMRL